MPNQIFINYRRSDSAGHAIALYNVLKEQLGKSNVFMDVDTIEPGMDFIEEIEKTIAKCNIFLVLIGSQWLTTMDNHGKRLDNPDDFVRNEIELALERDVRIIPVLVDGAAMPTLQELPSPLKPLSRRNAIEISNNRFNSDVTRLIRAIDQASRPPEAASDFKEPSVLTVDTTYNKHLQLTFQDYETEDDFELKELLEMEIRETLFEVTHKLGISAKIDELDISELKQLALSLGMIS